MDFFGYLVFAVTSYPASMASGIQSVLEETTAPKADADSLEKDRLGFVLKIVAALARVRLSAFWRTQLHSEFEALASLGRYEKGPRFPGASFM